MVYAYDQWAKLPMHELYNSLMMNAAVNAAKDMYNKAEKQLDDFNNKYGDFQSPFQKDMDRYNEIVGGVLNTINNLYESGADPLRTSEGRAQLAAAIRSVNPAEINRMKANAKTGYAYLDSMQKLQAAGKYDPEMNAAYLRSIGAPSFEDFSSADGMWNVTSPVQAMSLKDLTSQYFDKRTAYDLSKGEVERFGIKYDPNAKYKGYSYDALYNDAGRAIPGMTGTWYSDYFRDKAKQELLAKGVVDPTRDQIDRQLQSDIAEANREYLIRPTADYDDHYKRQNLALQREANSLRRQAQQTPKDTQTLGQKASDYNQLITIASGTTDPRQQGLYIKGKLQNIMDGALVAAGKRGADGKADRQSHFNILTDRNRASFTNYALSALRSYMDTQLFPTYSGGIALNDERFPNAIRLDPSEHPNLLYSSGEVLSHMYGYYGKKATTNEALREQWETNPVDNKGNQLGNGWAIVPVGTEIPWLSTIDDKFHQMYEVRVMPLDNNGNVMGDIRDYPIMLFDDKGQTSVKNNLTHTIRGKGTGREVKLYDEHSPVDFTTGLQHISAGRPRAMQTDQALKARTNVDTEVPLSDTEVGKWGQVDTGFLYNGKY